MRCEPFRAFCGARTRPRSSAGGALATLQSTQETVTALGPIHPPRYRDREGLCADSERLDDLTKAGVFESTLDALAFHTEEAAVGPDLLRPRPHLRTDAELHTPRPRLMRAAGRNERSPSSFRHGRRKQLPSPPHRRYPRQLVEARPVCDQRLRPTELDCVGVRVYGQHLRRSLPVARRPIDPPLGPTVDDLATAVTEYWGSFATEPIDLVLDGFAGKYTVLTVPNDLVSPAAIVGISP